MTFVLSTRNKVSTFAAAAATPHVIHRVLCKLASSVAVSVVSNEHTSEHYDDDYKHEISNIHNSHMNMLTLAEKLLYCISRNTLIL